MTEAILLTLLFIAGFVLFSLVTGFLVGHILSSLLSPGQTQTDNADRSTELRRYARRCSAITAAIVGGLIGVLAMLFDGPIAEFLR